MSDIIDFEAERRRRAEFVRALAVEQERAEDRKNTYWLLAGLVSTGLLFVALAALQFVERAQ